LANGNVGIGTTNPQRKLVVYQGDSGQAQIQFQNVTTGSVAGDGFGVGLDSSEKGFIWNYEGNDTYIGGAGGTSITIQNGGNVGIGTTGPSALLDLETAGNTLDGSYYSTMTINNTGSSTYSGVRFDRSGASRWRVGLMPDDTFQIAKLYNTVDDGAFVIDSNGKVGIGTAAPNSRLMVIDTTDARKQIEFGNHVTYRGSIGHDAQTGRNEYRTEAGGGMHAFFKGATSTTPEMIIDNNGNVGIGTAGSSSGIQLQIGNTANNSAVTRVTNGTTFVDLTASSSGKAYLEVGSNHPLILATNATERMQITADGVVSAPIASTHGGQLNGAATPDPLASYLGSNGADFGTTAIYRTPVITSSSTTQATSQFLSIYSSGHWGQYPVFRFKVYSTYYTAGYREYVGRVSHSQAELVEVQLNGTTSFIGSGGQNSITMSSAVSSGLAAHSGQARFRRDFTLTSFGVYGRCYVVVEIMYGGNAYYGSNTTTADLDADGNSGGSYHFKTMSLAQGQGTFSST
jgi:hypothetical protein